jgi:hypothetical protein
VLVPGIVIISSNIFVEISPFNTLI